MKQLSRKKIQDMIDLNGANISSRRSSGGSGAGGGGGVSSAWVDEHYVSKDFFARLFTINGTTTEGGVTTDVVVEPNDLDTDITDIQAMVGLWTEEYLSALGQGSGGGGGGGALLTEPLASINEAGMGTPSGTSDQVIAYSRTLGRWHYADLGSGSGTVRSITLTTPQNSGLLVALGSGTPGNTATITNEGTFALSFGTDYSLVSPTDRTKWNAASDVADVTWWGQSIQSQTSGGVTTKFVSGNMTNVGSITMSDNIYMSRGKNVSFYYGNAYLGALGIFGDYDVLHLGYYTALEGIQTNVYGDIVRLYYGTSATLGMILNASGNVGIGQASPGYKLDVNGTINCTSIRIGGITITYDSSNGGLRVNNAGLYADTYISALGAGSGGGGGTVLTEPLATINEAGLGAPPSGQGEKVIAFGTNGWHYANLSSGGGATSLGNLTDVTLSSLSDGQALIYNNSRGKWVNQNVTKLEQTAGITSLSTFYSGDALTYTAAGGSNTVTDKPSGVDAFGVISFKTASGYHGQILVDAGGTTYIRSASSLSGGWNKVAYTDSTVAKADRLSGNNPYTAWNQTYWSNGVPATIRGTMSDVDDIIMNNNHFIRILLSDGTTDINMMGIDSSNNISLFYGAYVNGLTPYINGNEVGIATGSPSGSTYYSLFRNTGHLTINAYDNLDSTVFRNPTPFLIVGGGICGTGLFTNASVGETIKLHTTSTYNCIQFFTGGTSQWSVGTDNNGTFYWYTQPGGNKTVMSMTSGGNLGIGRTPGYKLDVNGTINCTSIRIGGITITADTSNGGLHVNSAGLYADTYISALGAGSGGGGGTVLTEPLATINQAGLGAPPSGQGEKVIAFGTNGWHYANLSSGGGATSLGNLTDVTLSSLLDGQALIYNNSQGRWVNQNVTKLEQTAGITSLSTFYSGDALTYTAAGGSNTVTDKPSGVDAFGVISFKTASGYHGQILVDAGGTMYVRSASSLSGGWQKVLTDSNYATELSGKVTNAMLAGSISNSKLVNSSVTINGTTISLGSADTSTARWGTKRTVTIKDNDGTNSQSNANIDGSANFDLYLPSTIKASLTGNASTATKLYSTIKLWGNNFDGSTSIGANGSNASLSYVSNISMFGALQFYNGTVHKMTMRWGTYDNNDVLIMYDWDSTINRYHNILIGTYTDSIQYGGMFFDGTTWSWGIGTASPKTKLEVNGGVLAKKIYLYKPNAANDTGSVYLTYDSTNSGVHLVGAGLYADTYLSALGAGSGGGGGATLNEPLDGINNSGLGAPLPGTQTGAAIVFNGTNWTYSHSQGIVANYFDSIGYIRAINNITSTSGNLQITSGRAAIGGAVNTSYKLYVAGNICSNYMVLGDDATVGTVTCTTIKTLSSRGLSVQTSGNAPCYTNVAWSTSSDMRLKRVIEDITTDISNIAKAPIFNFEWIKGGNKALGTSAQYWQNIFPYAVLGDQNNYLSMDYGGVALAAAVITARRVVELEKKIKELESKLQ